MSELKTESSESFECVRTYADGLANSLLENVTDAWEESLIERVCSEFLDECVGEYLGPRKKRNLKKQASQVQRQRKKESKVFSLRTLQSLERQPSIRDLDPGVAGKIKRSEKILKRGGSSSKMKPNPLQKTAAPRQRPPSPDPPRSAPEPSPEPTPSFFFSDKLNLRLRAKKNLSGIQEENTEEIEDSQVVVEKKVRDSYLKGWQPKVGAHVVRMQKPSQEVLVAGVSFIEGLAAEFDFQPTTEIKRLVEKIRKNDRDLESLFRLTSLILQNSKDLGLFEKGLLHIQKLNSEYKKKEISFALGKLNFMKGRWDASLFYLKKNYNYSIKKDRALNYMVKILMKQRNLNKAKVACDKWIELSPGNCRALYIKGKILYREHDFEGALELFVRVVDQNLNHFKALLYLGFIKQVWEDSPEDARVCFEGVVANRFAGSKFKSRAYFGLSVLFQHTDGARALQFMKSAIKYSSADWGLKKTLGDMLVRLRKFRQAVSVYKSLLQEKEEDLGLLFAMGTIYMITAEYLKAMKYFVRVIELSGKILEIRFEGLFAGIFQSDWKQGVSASSGFTVVNVKRSDSNQTRRTWFVASRWGLSAKT